MLSRMPSNTMERHIGKDRGEPLQNTSAQIPEEDATWSERKTKKDGNWKEKPAWFGARTIFRSCHKFASIRTECVTKRLHRAGGFSKLPNELISGPRRKRDKTDINEQWSRYSEKEKGKSKKEQGQDKQKRKVDIQTEESNKLEDTQHRRKKTHLLVSENKKSEFVRQKTTREGKQTRTQVITSPFMKLLVSWMASIDR